MYWFAAGIIILLFALHALYVANELDLAAERRRSRRALRIAVGLALLGIAAVVAGCRGGLV